MDLCHLHPDPKARRQAKRVGRGISAGQGKTSGRGENGQKARYTIRPGFEGGQTPLHRRIPKLRGQSSKAHNIGMFRAEYAVVNVGTLGERFEAEAEISPARLLAEGLISKLLDGVKVLGEGKLDKPLHVTAHAFSRTAREKIEGADGTAEVIQA